LDALNPILGAPAISANPHWTKKGRNVRIGHEALHHETAVVVSGHHRRFAHLDASHDLTGY